MPWVDPQVVALIALGCTQLATWYVHAQTRRREQQTDYASKLNRLEEEVQKCHKDRVELERTIEDLREQIIALNAAMVRYLMHPGGAPGPRPAIQ